MNYDQYQSQLHHFETTENKNIAYLDEGKGPVILLLHGVPTSSYLYRKMVPFLIAGDFRVVAPDLLGYGDSDKPEGYEIYTHEKQAERIIQLMDHLSINKWHHVCHDMGGLVTWQMLKSHQERVDKLSLLNTIIFQEGFHPPFKFKRNFITKWYTKLYCSNLFGKGMMVATMRNGTTEPFEFKTDELSAYTLPMMQGGSHALNYFFAQTGNPIPDVSSILDSLSVPVQVIWGATDNILVWKDQADKVVKHLRISPENVHVLNNAKHFIQEEKPELIAQLLMEFERKES